MHDHGVPWEFSADDPLHVMQCNREKMVTTQMTSAISAATCRDCRETDIATLASVLLTIGHDCAAPVLWLAGIAPLSS